MSVHLSRIIWTSCLVLTVIAIVNKNPGGQVGKVVNCSARARFKINCRSPDAYDSSEAKMIILFEGCFLVLILDTFRARIHALFLANSFKTFNFYFLSILATKKSQLR